jgi:hypothetical protein
MIIRVIKKKNSRNIQRPFFRGVAWTFFFLDGPFFLGPGLFPLTGAASFAETTAARPDCEAFSDLVFGDSDLGVTLALGRLPVGRVGRSGTVSLDTDLAVLVNFLAGFTEDFISVGSFFCLISTQGQNRTANNNYII